MFRTLAIGSILLSSAAPSQLVTSYKSNNVPPMDGDANKIVCQKEETIGTRLGAKKVCLTVADWNARARENRETTERIQGGTCQVGEGQYCLDPR
jgi:hypothetical protein